MTKTFKCCAGLLAGLWTLVLLSCSSQPVHPDWRISFSFEDEISCSQYRRIEIYADGTIAYLSGAGDTEQTLRISPDAVLDLESMIKAFPVVDAGVGEDFVGQYETRAGRPQRTVGTVEFRHRGTSVEVARLRDRIADLTQIQWKEIVSANGKCARPRYPLPSGSIYLADDIQ